MQRSISRGHNQSSFAPVRAEESGATLVEASLVISVLLAFITFIIDLGYIFLIQNTANRAAYLIIETAKTDQRFASETRNYSVWPTTTSSTINDFMSARTSAINAGIDVISTMSHGWDSPTEPRRMRFRLPNFTGGTVYSEGALLFPGQSAVLETPDGEETYRHIRIDKMNDPECRGANAPASCSCDQDSCPDLYAPGSAAWLAEARRNPPMSLVVVRVKPLLFLRFIRPTITIIGRAYASPERAPVARNATIPGLTCGRLFPVDPGWTQYAGYGRWACAGVTCPSNLGCMRAPDSTETTDGSNCGICRPITCAEMYSHGGYAGWHWTVTWAGIKSTCLAQSGVSGDPDSWPTNLTMGDLTNDPVPSMNVGYGSPIPAQCVTCRLPKSCIEAFGFATLPACPDGQQRIEANGWWDAKPASELTLDKCAPCEPAGISQTCRDVNPPQPSGCTDPVFLPDNSYDAAQSGGNCWACQGTCSSRNVTVAAACGTCTANETCTTYGSSTYSSDANCCNRSYKPCSDWQGAGTCNDPTFVALLNAQNKDCKMVGNSAAGACTGVGVCRNTCPASLTTDENCQCVCQCPTGTFRAGDDPNTCICLPASSGCTPARTSCDDHEILVGTCCVAKN